MDILQKIQKTMKAFSIEGFKPSTAIIAGSGLDCLSKNFTVVKTIPYSKIPYFSKTTVVGHIGNVEFCVYKKTQFLIFNGRSHYYEGLAASDVVYPVRVIGALGIKKLIITAAVGALNKKYRVGDIVAIKDHINFTGNDPLVGKHYARFGERFVNMESVYDKNLSKLAFDAAKKHKIKLLSGVYFGVSGPAYETPSEAKAYRLLGADIVGMSVVYEAIAAAQLKLKTLGLAYVSNISGDAGKKPLNHLEVLKAGKQISLPISKIIGDVL